VQKLNTKVGGIVENYTQRYNGDNKNFTVFLPYINIQYIHNKKFNVVAKFHSVADYPDINQLIPYKVAQDSLMYAEGNPGLKTVITNTVGLDFNMMGFITLSPYYSFDNSHIASYVSIDPDNNHHYLSQMVNVDKYERYGIGLNFTVPFGKTIFWQNRLDWYKNRLAYNGESYDVNNFAINSNIIYVNSKAGIVAGLILQKQANKEAGIQGYSTNGNDILLSMFRKSFFKQRLNVSAYYMLPVNMGLKYNLPNLTETNSYYQLSHMSLNLIKNLMFFEISYRFASGKEAKAKTSSDSDAEQKKKSMFGL
jgi:Outer membrane receptor for ferrienterochelin and colicins